MDLRPFLKALPFIGGLLTEIDSLKHAVATQRKALDESNKSVESLGSSLATARASFDIEREARQKAEDDLRAAREMLGGARDAREALAAAQLDLVAKLTEAQAYIVALEAAGKAKADATAASPAPQEIVNAAAPVLKVAAARVPAKSKKRTAKRR